MKRVINTLYYSKICDKDHLYKKTNNSWTIYYVNSTTVKHLCIQTNCIQTNCIQTNCIQTNCIQTNCIQTNCIQTNCIQTNCIQTNCLQTTCLQRPPAAGPLGGLDIQVSLCLKVVVRIEGLCVVSYIEYMSYTHQDVPVYTSVDVYSRLPSVLNHTQHTHTHTRARTYTHITYYILYVL